MGRLGAAARAAGACRGFGVACYDHVCDREAVRRCAVIALVVGTILTLVNQAERLDDLPSSPVVAIRVALNYLIPFAVSSLGRGLRPRAPSSNRPWRLRRGHLAPQEALWRGMPR